MNSKHKKKVNTNITQSKEYSIDLMNSLMEGLKTYHSLELIQSQQALQSQEIIDLKAKLKSMETLVANQEKTILKIIDTKMKHLESTKIPLIVSTELTRQIPIILQKLEKSTQSDTRLLLLTLIPQITDAIRKELAK